MTVSFNPATVRLELKQGWNRNDFEEFQPRNGSIGIMGRAKDCKLTVQFQPRNGSIGIWNLAELFEGVMFQPRNGSIGISCLCMNGTEHGLFQPRNGSIGILQIEQ